VRADLDLLVGSVGWTIDFFTTVLDKKMDDSLLGLTFLTQTYVAKRINHNL
jgi:hypothetical protein